MQRKKKVETYDGESFAAAPQLPQTAYPSGAVMREHAQPGGSRPGVSSPNPVQGKSPSMLDLQFCISHHV